MSHHTLKNACSSFTHPANIQRVKNLLAMRETWVPNLCQEDPLEKERAAHSIVFAWRIPRTEEPGGLQSTGSQRLGHNRATNTFPFKAE